MTATVGLAGDTMLGRRVADRIRDRGVDDLFGAGVHEVAAEADVLVCNLECCISDRGTRWDDPRKPFFFRAPPAAVSALRQLGVDAVTLANNHALDFRAEALADTLDLLDEAGIARVGAGRTRAEARRGTVVEGGGAAVGLVGLTDHPEDYAATPDGPGVAWADLRSDGPPGWVGDQLADLDADLRLLTPHWGPNMTTEPVGHVRRTAERLPDLPVDLVAGHSAHVFHGVGTVGGDGRSPLPVLFDLGDFIDDYAVDERLRNNLGLLWLVTVDGSEVRQVEAVPLHLRYCRTELAEGDERRWIVGRLRDACRELGTEVRDQGGRPVIVVS